MNSGDLLDLVGKEKRNKERVKAAQKLAVGIGIVSALAGAIGFHIALKLRKETSEDMKKIENTVEDIKDTVQKEAASVRYSVDNALQKVCNVIDDAHEKTVDEKKDVRDDNHEITEDIHKTAKNISNEINKPVSRETQYNNSIS